MAALRSRLVPLGVLVGTVASAAASWLLVWLLARLSGATEVGRYTLVLAFAAPVFIAGQLGLRNLYLTWPDPAPFGSWLKLRAAATGAAALVFAVGAAMLQFPTDLSVAMVGWKVSDTFVDAWLGRLQFCRRLNAMATLMVARPVVQAVAMAVIMLGWNASAAAGLGAISTANVAIMLFAATRCPPDAPALPIAALWPVLRPAAQMVSAQVAVSLLLYLPVWTLAHTGTASEVGRWAGASYLIVAANLVGSSVQTVVLTSYREAAVAGTLQPRVCRHAIRLLAAGCVGAVVVVGCGDPVLAAVYGPTFTLGFGPLLALAVAAALSAPSFVLNAALMASNRYQAPALAAWGAVGASAVTGVVGSLLGTPALLTAAGVAGVGAAVRLAISAAQNRAFSALR